MLQERLINMPYRSPDRARLAAQTNQVMQYAGFTGVWRQYISASAGVSVAGFGSAVSYREQTITAVLGSLMGNIVTPGVQRQTTMGQVGDGTLRILTKQQLSDKDEFIWRGVRYRVDANSQPSQINGYWMSMLMRGDS
jgi:hypothetical protein